MNSDKTNFESYPSFTRVYKVACCDLRITISFNKDKKPIKLIATSTATNGCHSNHAFISDLITSILHKHNYDDISKLKGHSCTACINLRKKLPPEQKNTVYRSCGDAICHALEHALNQVKL